MPEIIFISELVTLGFGNAVIKSEKPVFDVKYARVRDEASLEKLLSGAVFADLNQHAILEYCDVVPPDGTPLENFDIGHGAISSLDEALSVAKAARINPQSILKQKNFPENTPIYLFKKGQPASNCE